jgi:hypothetical protein
MFLQLHMQITNKGTIMATGTIASYTYITTITGYAAVGEARYGSNGAIPGTPEYDVSDSNGNSVDGRLTWYSGTGAFDSGKVQTTFDAEPGGGSNGVNWTVQGGSVSPVTLTSATYGSIQKVEIVAAVQMPASMTWSSVQVSFYKAGSLIEQYTRRTGPSVNLIGNSPPVAAEQILTVTPSQNDNDKVVVTGYIELACAAGSTPGANDIFGQVFLFA